MRYYYILRLLALAFLCTISSFCFGKNGLSKQHYDCNILKNSSLLSNADELQKDILEFWLYADENCIKSVVHKFKKDTEQLIIYTRYQSKAIEFVPDRALIQTLGLLSYGFGERFVFSIDKNLTDSLKHRYERANSEDREAIEFMYKYALSTLEPDKIDMNDKLSIMLTPYKYLSRERLRPFCETRNCSMPDDINEFCSLTDIISLKYSLLMAENNTLEKLYTCQIDMDKLIQLRFFGILDSRCTFAMQSTAILEGGLSAKTTCDKLLIDIPTTGAKSITDLLAYIYFKRDNISYFNEHRDKHIRNKEIFKTYFHWLKDEHVN